jgi:hypothetical protein
MRQISIPLTAMAGPFCTLHRIVGHLGVAKLLFRGGADVNVLDKDNKTAAEPTSINGKNEVTIVVNQIQDAGAVLLHANNQGRQHT